MRASLYLLVIGVVSVAMAQRSNYAPKPVGYPQVLDRFNANAGTESTDANGIPNRIGGEPATDYQGPLQPQAGTIGDPYLVPRLPEWPREHQPFWYLNQQQIMNHRGQRLPGASTQAGPTAGPITQSGQNIGTRVQNAQSGTGTRLGTRLGEQGATSNVLGSQRHQSSFVRRPVHRPDEINTSGSS